jgi:hypothetical protein
VLDALDKGEAPPVTVEDARRTMEFVAALYASPSPASAYEPDRSPPTVRSPSGWTAPAPPGKE